MITFRIEATEEQGSDNAYVSLSLTLSGANSVAIQAKYKNDPNKFELAILTITKSGIVRHSFCNAEIADISIDNSASLGTIALAD